MKIDNKIALVFGGAGGIGAAICDSLLENGASVCCTDFDAIAGAKVADIWAKKYGGERSCFLRVDVTSTTSVEGAFEDVATRWQKAPDIVVNCAGILQEFDYEKCIDVNLTGMVRTLVTSLKYMGTDKGGSGGCFIAISSSVALLTYPPVPVYTATKSGVLSLIKVFGTEPHFGRTGVRVNTILPGGVKTPILERNTPEYCYTTQEDGGPPTNSLLEPEEVAVPVMDLLKDDNMNGKAVLITKKGGSEIMKFDQEAEIMAKIF